MSDDRYPLEIDFSAYLAGHAIFIPDLKIIIDETYWDESGKHDGKPACEYPVKERYFIGNVHIANNAHDYAYYLSDAYPFPDAVVVYKRYASWAVLSKMRHEHYFRVRKD